jgi:hypothetical protein
MAKQREPIDDLIDTHVWMSQKKKIQAHAPIQKPTASRSRHQGSEALQSRSIDRDDQKEEFETHPRGQIHRSIRGLSTQAAGR